jgi:ABC-type transporter Mla MlaB component
LITPERFNKSFITNAMAFGWYRGANRLEACTTVAEAKTLMLKITWESSHNEVLMRLDGRVMGRWVDELIRYSQSFLAEGRTLALDMSEVSFVDQKGVAVLQDLLRRGVTVARCTPFVSELLRIEPLER